MRLTMESIRDTRHPTAEGSVPKFLQGYGKQTEHGGYILPKAVNIRNEQDMIPLTKRLLANQRPHVRIDVHDVQRSSF